MPRVEEEVHEVRTPAGEARVVVAEVSKPPALEEEVPEVVVPAGEAGVAQPQFLTPSQPRDLRGAKKGMETRPQVLKRGSSAGRIARMQPGEERDGRVVRLEDEGRLAAGSWLAGRRGSGRYQARTISKGRGRYQAPDRRGGRHQQGSTGNREHCLQEKEGLLDASAGGRRQGD